MSQADEVSGEGDCGTLPCQGYEGLGVCGDRARGERGKSESKRKIKSRTGRKGTPPSCTREPVRPLGNVGDF
jgi:hypothetical protein